MIAGTFKVRSALISELLRLVRYYQAAIINTAFGYGVFSFLVFIGIPALLSQVVSHFAGVAFNYLTYSRHVFRDQQGSIPRFVFSYIASGLMSFLLFLIIGKFISSPYTAGFLAMVLTSLLMYYVLSRLVFVRSSIR